MTVRLPFAVPTDDEFSAQSYEQLSTLLSQVRSAAGEFAEMDSDELSEEDLTIMAELAEFSTRAKARMRELAESEDEGAVRASRKERGVAAFSALMDVLGDDEDTEGEDEDDEAEPEQPVSPPAAKPKAAPKKSTYAARKPAVPGVASAAKVDSRGVPAEREAEGGNAVRASLIAAAGSNMQAGAEITWLDVAKQLERNISGYRGMTGQIRNGVAQIRIEYPEELTAAGMPEDDSTAFVARVASEKRLPGGSLLASMEIRRKAALANGASELQSLTAAGIGWCAPSEVLYDLCELETNDGMIDVPEMNVPRGGIKFTTGPNFRSIWGGTGFFDYTEAQIISGVTKPCMLIPCPTFDEERLDAVGLCLTADLLSLRGYPEVISRYTRGSMVAFNHRVNAKVINSMVAGSTAVTLNAGTFAADTSIMDQFLAALALAIADYKYGNRMSQGATLEVVAPWWLLSAIQTDLTRRAFYDGDNGRDQMALALRTINEWAAARGARVQWPYDWQDAFYWGLYPAGAAPAHTRFGADPTDAAAVVNDWPPTFDILIYAAGTWVRGNADVINLDTVYDSTLLAQNKATQLFMEQGILVAKTCVDSRVYTIGGVDGFGPTGQTFAPITYPVVGP